MAPIDVWPWRLEAIIRDRRLCWKRIVVLRETESTQDAARRLNAAAGDVITAWRQTAGRGRLGRSWADTGEDGLAVTFVLGAGRDAAPAAPYPERLAIASAIATAQAIEAQFGDGLRVGIKWPNDIIVNQRKLAGILIEQFAQHSYIGIGVNVTQTQWDEFPGSRDSGGFGGGGSGGRPISMQQIALGREFERLLLLQALMVELNEALAISDDDVIAAFAARDVLRGKRISVRSANKFITGTVLRIDPLAGLLLRDEAEQEHWLRAAVTTIIDWPGSFPQQSVPTLL